MSKMTPAQRNAKRRVTAFMNTAGAQWDHSTDSWGDLYMTITRDDGRHLVIEHAADGWVTADKAARAFLEDPDGPMFFKTDDGDEGDDEGTYFLA